MHFSEIIKLQFEEEHHTSLCILKLFKNIVYELSLKNMWFTPIFFFRFSMTLVKIFISHIIINRGKNTFELVSTALKFRFLGTFCVSLNVNFPEYRKIRKHTISTVMVCAVKMRPKTSQSECPILPENCLPYNNKIF